MSEKKTDGTELARLGNLRERISVLEEQRSGVAFEKENLDSEIREHHRLEAIGEKPYGDSDRGKDLDRSRGLDRKLEEVSAELDGLSLAIPELEKRVHQEAFEAGLKTCRAIGEQALPLGERVQAAWDEFLRVCGEIDDLAAKHEAAVRVEVRPAYAALQKKQPYTGFVPLGESEFPLARKLLQGWTAPPGEISKNSLPGWVAKSASNVEELPAPEVKVA